ncbi:hypothetical protein [Paludibacterium paludis]|uniref:Uncharacterized protein n=1 Tax=Paludibacterium paludis TaxID=1225769 RepID=A0A918P2L0_9NEIS|nr:hypothetical protein [Paludibacterium paludis]GGY14816.1 hypothetical protein GCM10011289_17690 [Paludibacterium paludis]
MSETVLMTDAEIRPATRLRYRIVSNGETVGELTAERGWESCDGGRMLSLSNAMHIQSSGLWSDYTLDSREAILIDEGGVRRYLGEEVEDGVASSATGSRERGVLTLSIVENTPRTQVFSVDDYDATSEDAPAFFLASGSADSVLRVLDLDRFEVEAVRYRLHPAESFLFEGRALPVRVVEFASRHASGMQWWAEDATGDILVRQISREQGDQNEVLLIHWERT